MVVGSDHFLLCYDTNWQLHTSHYFTQHLTVLMHNRTHFSFLFFKLKKIVYLFHFHQILQVFLQVRSYIFFLPWNGVYACSPVPQICSCSHLYANISLQNTDICINNTCSNYFIKILHHKDTPWDEIPLNIWRPQRHKYANHSHP